MAKLTVLAGDFANVKELQKYCDAQYVSLHSSLEQIKTLEDKVKHLEKLLTDTTTLIADSSTQKIIKSPELIICEVQLEILQNRALQKELTLEEIKAVDLLIKNKRLITGDATSIEGTKKKPKIEYSDAELVLLAKIEPKLVE